MQSSSVIYQRLCSFFREKKKKENNFLCYFTHFSRKGVPLQCRIFCNEFKLPRNMSAFSRQGWMCAGFVNTSRVQFLCLPKGRISFLYIVLVLSENWNHLWQSQMEIFSLFAWRCYRDTTFWLQCFECMDVIGWATAKPPSAGKLPCLFGCVCVSLWTR